MNRSRAVIWADAGQDTLIRDAVARADLTVVALGSPDLAVAADLCREFGAERVDDAREAMLRTDGHVVWLASVQTLDADARRLMDHSRTPVVTLQPPYHTIAEAMAEPTVEAAGPVFAPLLRRSQGFRAALDLLPQFGEVECINVFVRSGPGQGTLFARLYDAMDIIERFCGPIEALHASLAAGASASPPPPPESLDQLRGHMTANMRFKPDRCASVALSDSAGSWFRGATVLGENGCLRIRDGGFEWIGRDGALIDRQGDSRPPSPGELIGDQIQRLLDDKDVGDPPLDHVNLLALCEAARLSCLTGQDEAPGKLIHMLSRP